MPTQPVPPPEPPQPPEAQAPASSQIAPPEAQAQARPVPPAAPQPQPQPLEDLNLLLAPPGPDPLDASDIPSPEVINQICRTVSAISNGLHIARAPLAVKRQGGAARWAKSQVGGAAVVGGVNRLQLSYAWHRLAKHRPDLAQRAGSPAERWGRIIAFRLALVKARTALALLLRTADENSLRLENAMRYRNAIIQAYVDRIVSDPTAGLGRRDLLATLFCNQALVPIGAATDHDFDEQALGQDSRTRKKRKLLGQLARPAMPDPLSPQSPNPHAQRTPR